MNAYILFLNQPASFAFETIVQRDVKFLYPFPFIHRTPCYVLPGRLAGAQLSSHINITKALDETCACWCLKMRACNWRICWIGNEWDLLLGLPTCFSKGNLTTLNPKDRKTSKNSVLLHHEVFVQKNVDEN